MVIMKSDKRAFTLLELLVAMTMMSIIATSLYASLSIGFKAKENSENSIDATRSAQVVMDLLKQEIVSALPPRGLLAGKFEGTDGHGESGNDADSLVFYSAAYNPGEDEVACDIVKVEITILTKAETNESVLVRGLTKNLLSPKSLEPYEDILCSGIESMNIRYYDGYDWLDEWDSGNHEDSLPMAVEVSIRLEASNKKDKDNKNVYSLTCSFTLPCA